MSSTPRKSLFERLQQGLVEGIAHSQGELTLRTVVMPEAPPTIDAATLISLRNQAGMSQPVFARLLNVSPKTVQSWGTRSADPIARFPPPDSDFSANTPRSSARVPVFPRSNFRA